jgi:DNA-binding GntR family transcriptional regulator
LVIVALRSRPILIFGRVWRCKDFLPQEQSAGRVLGGWLTPRRTTPYFPWDTGEAVRAFEASAAVPTARPRGQNRRNRKVPYYRTPICLDRRMLIQKKERLSNLAYQAIKTMIAEHRFQPGARINVENLTRELGVSRTPVWEAVMRLEQEGLVRNEPNRGVYMLELTLNGTLHLYQVRGVLEGLAAQLAAGHMDDDTLAAMASNLQLQAKAVKELDLMAYSRLDYEFHALIYGACGNPYLQETLEVIKNKMRPLALRLEPLLTSLYSDHLRLFKALKASDPKGSEEAFRAHNQRVLVHIARIQAAKK